MTKLSASLAFLALTSGACFAQDFTITAQQQTTSINAGTHAFNGNVIIQYSGPLTTRSNSQIVKMSDDSRVLSGNVELEFDNVVAKGDEVTLRQKDGQIIISSEHLTLISK